MKANLSQQDVDDLNRIVIAALGCSRCLLAFAWVSAIAGTLALPVMLSTCESGPNPRCSPMFGFDPSATRTLPSKFNLSCSDKDGCSD